MKVVALDFDGVISDSARESYVVAARAYLTLRPFTPAAAAPAELLDDGGVARHDFAADPVFTAFLRLMPLGNRAEDYAVMLAIIEGGGAVSDQAAYDAIRGGHERSSLLAFHERFYEIRRAFAHAAPDLWRRLQPAYAPLVEILRRRAGDATLAIATAKDRASTLALLRDYGLAGAFADELVLDKEAGTSKVSHLRALRARLGCAFADITFVDDKVNHLQAVAPLGVRCVLAAWGYNGAPERDTARTLGFPVCSLEDVEPVLLD